MKHRMVLIAIALLAIPACTPADDVDGEVHEYH